MWPFGESRFVDEHQLVPRYSSKYIASDVDFKDADFQDKYSNAFDMTLSAIAPVLVSFPGVVIRA